MGTVHVDLSGVESAIKVVNNNIGIIAQAVENVGTRYPSGEVHSFRRFWKMIH